jgi:hypothetical protein
MAKKRVRIVDKCFRLDPVKISRVRKALHASTETEAIDLALDLALAEHEHNRITTRAHQKFLRSGIIIRDVYEKLC